MLHLDDHPPSDHLRIRNKIFDAPDRFTACLLSGQTLLPFLLALHLEDCFKLGDHPLSLSPANPLFFCPIWMSNDCAEILPEMSVHCPQSHESIIGCFIHSVTGQ